MHLEGRFNNSEILFSPDSNLLAITDGMYLYLAGPKRPSPFLNPAAQTAIGAPRSIFSGFQGHFPVIGSRTQLGYEGLRRSPCTRNPRTARGPQTRRQPGFLPARRAFYSRRHSPGVCAMPASSWPRWTTAVPRHSCISPPCAIITPTHSNSFLAPTPRPLAG